MSYCTHCEEENPDRRIRVNIEEEVVIDGDSTGVFSDNYTLCSAECVEQVLQENSEYDTEYIAEIVERVAEEGGDSQ